MFLLSISVEPGSDTALVTLDASASYDPDGDIVSYLWKEDSVVLGSSAVIEVALTVGTHDILLKVTDNDGFSSSDSVNVVVEAANAAPVADAGADQQISAEYGSETATVTLDGSASYDLDGNIVSYLWKEDDVVLGSSAVIEVALSVETHDITLTVTDNDGLTATDTMQVVVMQKAPSGQRIYVEDIRITAKKKGKVWDVIAEVTIFDDSSNPVKSAEVFGNWSGSVNQTVSAVTFSKGKKRIGRTKFTLSRISRGGTFTFTIADVKKSGMIYDDALNVETSDTIVIQ